MTLTDTLIHLELLTKGLRQQLELRGAAMRQESREPQPTETRGRGKVQCKRTERERIVDPRTERSGKNFIFKFYRALFRDNF